MPKILRSGQDWILDRFVMSLGIDALMPSFSLFAASPVVGFNVADLQTIADQTRGVQSMRKAYERAAERRQAIAEEAEAAGHLKTARRHFHLASLYWGVAQYTIQKDGSHLKAELHARCQACYAKVAAYADTPITKVEIPFRDAAPQEGDSFPGILHLPAGEGRHPCVVFLPGTDMYKEQLPNPEDNIFAKRGLACLTIDGPGQGESLLRMLKVKVESWNYERAVSAAIDFLQDHPNIDSNRIAVFGVSTGSYWSVRAAIHEARNKDRIRATAGLLAQWERGFVTEFEYAQPMFKSNYMYMAGIDDEAEFDRQAPLHVVDELISEVTCPIFIGQGEFDEICAPEQVEEILQGATQPHELRIFEDEFHPLGLVATEAYEGAVDWLADRLADKPVEPSGVRILKDSVTVEVRSTGANRLKKPSTESNK